jgi:hypothetical protein
LEILGGSFVFRVWGAFAAGAGGLLYLWRKGNQNSKAMKNLEDVTKAEGNK